MRVLIIEAPQWFPVAGAAPRPILPLGPAYIAAAAEQAGHEVELCVPDAMAADGDDPWGDLLDRLASSEPDVVGISTVTPTLDSAGLLLEGLRTRLPRAVFVLGGVHPTVAPAHAAALRGVDAVVVGDGEVAFTSLLEAVQRGASAEAMAQVPGVATAASTGSGAGRPAPTRLDPDELPWPKRDGIFGQAQLPSSFCSPLLASRGCPHRCSFCSAASLGPRRSRVRAAQKVVREIRALVSDYGVENLFFCDPVFSLDRPHTLQLCQAMMDSLVAVPFACQTRVDCVDQEVLSALRRAGCVTINYGIESGSRETLLRTRKGFTLERARATVQMTRKEGIRCNGYFIIGFPWEDRNAMESTVEFATSIGLDAAFLFSATPLPGSELHSQLGLRPGPIGVKDFRAPEVNLTRMPDAEYQALYASAAQALSDYNQTGSVGRSR